MTNGNSLQSQSISPAHDGLTGPEANTNDAPENVASEVTAQAANDATVSSSGGGSGDAPPPEQGPSHSSGPKKEPNAKEPALARLAQRFVRRVDDMRQAALIALPAIATHLQEKYAEYGAILKQYETGAEGTQRTLKIPDGIHERLKVMSALTGVERIHESKMLPNMTRSLFVGLFSEFDAFIGHLLGTLYDLKPELVKGINKQFSFPEILKFDSIETIKRDAIEKEIDSFRRESYIDQFALLESKFKITTLTKFPEWTEFVEMSQRRNLMTHNDGVVSDQYITNCKGQKCALPKGTAVGNQLEIDPKYFARACHIVSVVAFMLTYTLWRKALPKDSEAANTSIGSSVYEWLHLKHWALAARLGEFSLAREMVAEAEEIDLCIRTVNLAIAYKKCDRKSDVARILNSRDWTAAIREFKLANAILNDEHEKAAAMMMMIGQSGEIMDQDSYHQWPLFIDFREQKEFLDAYRTIYGHDFDAGLSRANDSRAISPAGTGDADANSHDNEQPDVKPDALDPPDSEAA
ncbi:hypothetical protein PQR46_40335 [Paraburkholderia sediminicola]|uniref:hypothetical protein n=1 Tax=Paraburkholderia sediminicola TaxID=458836 RepID=UPI0038BA0564